MDLIDRQAAIDAIESHIRTAEEPYQLTQADKVLNHAFEVSASCIYNAPSAQPEQRWIPCSERLPEYDGEMYLVTDYCEQINRRRIHISYCYVNREGFWSDVPIGYKVIAWMPLPEPYVERRTDETVQAEV